MGTKVGKKKEAGKCFSEKLARIPIKVFAFAIKVSVDRLYFAFNSHENGVVTGPQACA